MKHSEEVLTKEELDETFVVSVRDIGGILSVGHRLGEATFSEDPRMPFFMVANKLNRNTRAIVSQLKAKEK